MRATSGSSASTGATPLLMYAIFQNERVFFAPLDPQVENPPSDLVVHAMKRFKTHVAAETGERAVIARNEVVNKRWRETIEQAASVGAPAVRAG